VSLYQPSLGANAVSRGIRITLTPDSTAAGAQGLRDSDPALADAAWVISIVPGKYSHAHTYSSTPIPPSDATIALWHQISDAVGPAQDLTGFTGYTEPRIPAPNQAQTEIEVDTPSGSGSELQAHAIAMSVADLSTHFGHPVTLILHTGDGKVSLIVGGCWQHDRNEKRLPLELELSHLYEHC